MSEESPKDDSGDLIGLTAYYWPLALRFIGYTALTELATIPFFVLAALSGSWRVEAVSDGAFFGLLFIAGRQLARHYAMSDAELGVSDESWQIYAVVGVLAAFASRSMIDLVVYLLAMRSHAGGGEYIPIFKGTIELFTQLRGLDLSDFLFIFVVKYLFAAFTEEFLCRGVIFGLIDRRDGPRWAFFWSSLIFSAWHQSALSLIFSGWELTTDALLQRTVMGMVFCWLRMRTGTLVAPLFAHVLHNCFVSVYLISIGKESLGAP